jgi:hypothetical protein
LPCGRAFAPYHDTIIFSVWDGDWAILEEYTTGFFVKTPVGYALVEFRMIPGNHDLQFKSYLNPNTSSRNLEYDPAR